MQNDERQKKPSTTRNDSESQRIQFVFSYVSSLLKKHAGILTFFEATRNNDAQKNKPVIVFKDKIDDGRIVGKCPKCDLLTLEVFKQDGEFFLRCESCRFTSASAEFELRYKPDDDLQTQ